MGIICAAVDCKHNSENNRCKLDKVTLSDHYIHTVYEGRQHFLRCKQYEKSEETKRMEEKFMKLLKEQGMEIIE